MTAKEAREKTDMEIGRRAYEPYAKVMAAIEIKIGKGESDLWYTNLPESVKDRLINEGYTVSNPVSSRNDTLTKISW